MAGNGPQTTTAAGTKFLITAGAPATQDKAGYSALAWTPVGSVEQIGTIGAVTGTTKFVPLDGAVQKFKGSTDYGSLQPSMAYDASDAGQLLMRNAAAPGNNAQYAFQLLLPTGETLYSQGRVFGYPYDIGNAEAVVMVKPTVELNVPIVYVPPAAG